MDRITFWLLLFGCALPTWGGTKAPGCNGKLTAVGTQGRTSNAELAVTHILDAAGIKINGPNPHDIRVKDPDFYRRILRDPLFEIGQTYMDGLWESDAVDEVITRLYASEQRNGRLNMFAPLWRTPGLAAIALTKNLYRYYRDLLTNRQTRTRSKTVAKEHYDAGNELYRRMLDPTLTYTSGIWAEGYTLEDAQNAKYDLICRKLNLQPGQHVLDIGSGFGGFARFAAKYYGAKVTGISISTEQLKVARALSGDFKDVNFVYSDYRDIPLRFAPNTFDHVVSIEMIEAVGPKNLNQYFQAANAPLKEGGRFVIQGIANNRDMVNTNPWFSKYIFSDGVAPSTNQVDEAAQSTFGAPVDRQRITAHYDQTLKAWHKNFTEAWPDLKKEYDEKFKRMWDFYLLSVQGGFRSKQIQLDQTVYVKGDHKPEGNPVRDLPSRERLDKMRATEHQKEFTEKSIRDIENEKKRISEALAPKDPKTQTPLSKNARIAIIGGGVSGLSAALELKNMGYTNVVVFEKEAEAGGKSHTIENGGKPYDLGATMGVPWKYAPVIRHAQTYGQPTIPMPKQNFYDLTTGGLVEKNLNDTMNKKFQGVQYLLHRIVMGGLGERGLEIPPEELADPFSVVLKRRGLGFFAEEMLPYLTGFGYGGPDTPAVYAERMLEPKAIMGSAVSRPMMWQNGTQPIWKGVASGLNVRTNSEVDHVERSADGVNLFLKNQEAPEVFEKLIMATDPKSALKVLDATAEEKSLFSQVKYMPYATFAVRVEGFAEGRTEAGYLKENMSLDRQGRPMAWIKRHADDNIFVFHLFAPSSLTDEQIMANITDDMGRLGAKKLNLVQARRWPFFPHVDAEAMREQQWFQRVNSLQGQNNTVFSNEAMAMSTMPDSIELGKKVAKRLAAGEY